MVRLNSQVMIAGGFDVIWHANLATDPSVTTADVGWLTKGEIPGAQKEGGSESCTP